MTILYIAEGTFSFVLLCLAGEALEVPHVLDGHLDDLRLLDPAPPLLRVRRRDQPAQVS